VQGYQSAQTHLEVHDGDAGLECVALLVVQLPAQNIERIFLQTAAPQWADGSPGDRL